MHWHSACGHGRMAETLGARARPGLAPVRALHVGGSASWGLHRCTAWLRAGGLHRSTLFMIPISPNQSLHMPGLASLSPGQPWDLQV